LDIILIDEKTGIEPFPVIGIEEMSPKGGISLAPPQF